ncbi:MAG: prepilin peptidase [Planctomycetota bacterium]
MPPPPVVYALVLFFFGLCVGSFLNVVICRLPRGVSLFYPGSMCPACGRKIAGAENLPLLSWILQGGRCRGCRRPISLRYPAVELLTGLAWAAVGYRFAGPYGAGAAAGIGAMLARLCFTSLLIAIAFIDYDLTLIPDGLNYTGVGFALAASTLFPALQFTEQESLSASYWYPAAGAHFNGLLAGGLGFLVGAGLMGVVLLIGTAAYRRKIRELREKDPEITTAVGFGDVKLMAFLGAFLGWQGILLAFLIGTIAGAVAGVIAKLRTGESLMPYGPYLCLGAFAVLLFRAPLVEMAVRHFTMSPPAGG